MRDVDVAVVVVLRNKEKEEEGEVCLRGAFGRTKEEERLWQQRVVCCCVARVGALCHNFFFLLPDPALRPLPSSSFPYLVPVVPVVVPVVECFQAI